MVCVITSDIECAGRKGAFPEPDIDKVIQIANVVTVHGQSAPIIRNVFTLNQCSPIVGADVLCFKTETDMLRAWRNFVQAVDADILTGNEITNLHNSVSILLKKSLLASRLQHYKF